MDLLFHCFPGQAANAGAVLAAACVALLLLSLLRSFTQQAGVLIRTHLHTRSCHECSVPCGDLSAVIRLCSGYYPVVLFFFLGWDCRASSWRLVLVWAGKGTAVQSATVRTVRAYTQSYAQSACQGALYRHLLVLHHEADMQPLGHLWVS